MSRPPPAGRSRARLSVPEVTGLSRPRLHAQLDQLLKVRLGMVIAPAGSGKTTLMAQWARRAPIDVAWYRADASDGTATAVVQQLGAALRLVAPGKPPARDIDGLVTAIEHHESPVALVIDDLHLIAHTHVDHLLQKLLLSGPPHLHLLVGSRRRPTFNMARTELTTIRLDEDDLRFRSDETMELFRDVYDEPLARDESAELTRHTEGWAAAIHLFHLSNIGRSPSDRRRAVRGLTGRIRYARDYLSTQILGSLPEDLHRFLRRTSVFEVLTSSRCDALLESHNAQRLLVDLERRQTLIRTDDGGATFRLHEVVRRHLETELLDELGGEPARAWYRRASTVLEADGAYAPALRAAAQARDRTGIRRLLLEYGAHILGDRSTDWLTAIPTETRVEEPWLLLAEADRAVRDGRLPEARRLTDQAASMFEEGDGREICRSVHSFVRTWSSEPAEPAASWAERLRNATRRDPGAVRRRRTGVTGPQGELLEALALAIAGDLQAAVRVLGQVVPRLDEDPAALLAARLALAALDASDGFDAGALAGEAERHGLPWFARLAQALATARRGPGQSVADGKDPLAALVTQCDHRADHWGAVLVSGARCVAQLRAGEPDVAALEDLVRRVHELDAPALEAWARAALALTAVAAQLPDAVREVQTAESFARTAAVPGALAVAYGAMALAEPTRRTELLGLADATADDAGLTWRPWTWFQEDPEPARLELPTSVSVPAPLSVRCFGRFELRVDGEQPALGRVRPRAREVLRLLALESGRPVHREMLIDALWRDLDPAAGTHNLHVCVSSLRAALEPGVPRGASRLLVRDGDRYKLALPPGSFSDLPAFDRALAEAERARAAGQADAAVRALDSAMELYTGEVLPADGPAEWVIGVRERYRVRAAEAAATLADLHLAGHDPGAAAAAALRSIDIDPCRDASWRLLIAAYTAAGDLAAAEQARRSYADVLSSLGVVSTSAAAVLPRPRRPD